MALADRRSTWLTAHVGLLREAVRRAQVERPFTVDAMVVLPEHLHSIFTLPPGDADFAHRWRRIKSGFTEGLRREGVVIDARENGKFVSWQRRFWEHTIRDDADYARHVDYITIIR